MKFIGLLIVVVLSAAEAQSQGACNSLSFEGGDYVRIADAPALRPTSLTIEGWFRFDTLAGLQLLVDKHLGGFFLDSYEMWIESGFFWGVISDGSGFGPFLNAPFSPTLGTWYHLAYAFDDASDTQSLFINGVLVATGAVTRSIAYDSEPLLIGASNDLQTPQLFFQGDAYDVRLWNFARTESEIQLDKDCTLTGNELGLIGHWRLDEGTGQVAFDSSPNANDGQLGSTPIADSSDPTWITECPLFWTNEGCFLPGIFGEPKLTGCGSLTPGSANSIELTDTVLLAPAALFIALSSNPVPFVGGTLKPFPFVVAPRILNTDAAGEILITFTMPSGIPSGTELWFQYAILDAAAIQGIALSNALLGITP